MAPGKTDPEDTLLAEEGGEGGVGGEVGEEERLEVVVEPYFDPVVTLPEVTVTPDSEREQEMVKLRCKLFRFHPCNDPPEWRERGTGDIKILCSKDSHRPRQVRLLMRQDKTLKVRANHYITPYMELRPSCGSDRAYVWCVVADFADEQPKQEFFAARFANVENARLFRESFDEARGIATVAEVKTREEEEEKKKEGEGEEEEEEEENKNNEEKKVDPTTTTTTTSSNSSSSSSSSSVKKEEEVVESLKDLKVSE